MTKRLTSKFKVYKQFGVQLWDKFKVIPPKKRTKGAKPNLVENANKYAGIHGYAVKWTEKQIFKKFYGNISEKQLKKYVTISKSTKDPMSTFIQQVESRLDVIIYRMFFADTVFSARQLINHGHITVNSRVITKPSYFVRPGDIIAPALGPAELNKSAQPSTIKENSERSGKRAILILENIVRRMVMIFKLNAKSLTYSFDRNVAIKGQVAQSIAIKRGADSIKYLKLLKMACSSDAMRSTQVVKQSEDNFQRILSNAKPKLAGQNPIAGSGIKKPTTISGVTAQNSKLKTGDTTRADFVQTQLRVPLVPELSIAQRSEVYTAVTFEVNKPELLRNTNAQMTSQKAIPAPLDVAASIIKSLDSAWPKKTATTQYPAKSKHEPLIGNLGTQAKNAKVELSSIKNKKNRSILQFTPYIKINLPLLTGIYLRHPEITDITYPKKLKFNLNRILNFYK